MEHTTSVGVILLPLGGEPPVPDFLFEKDERVWEAIAHNVWIKRRLPECL